MIVFLPIFLYVSVVQFLFHLVLLTIFSSHIFISISRLFPLSSFISCHTLGAFVFLFFCSLVCPYYSVSSFLLLLVPFLFCFSLICLCCLVYSVLLFAITSLCFLHWFSFCCSVSFYFFKYFVLTICADIFFPLKYDLHCCYIEEHLICWQKHCNGHVLFLPVNYWNKSLTNCCRNNCSSCCVWL